MSVLASGVGIGATAGVITTSITVPSNTKWLVVFPLWAGNTGRDVSTLTFNSVALTRQGSAYLNGTSSGGSLFTLQNPTPATANLVTTLNQSTVNASHFWAAIDEAGAILDSDGNATTAVTVDGASGGFFVVFGGRRNGATAVTLGGSQTLVVQDFSGFMEGVISSGAGAASLAATHTWTGGDAPVTMAIGFGAAAPTITVQPANDTAIISNGQSTVYTTTATGTTISALTWSEDGSPIADGGIYDIVTTGIGTGSVTSTLTITRTSKTGTPFDIKANVVDANGNTDTSTVTDTWWTGPVLTTFPATNGSGVSTATLTSDYVTGVGEAIEVRIPLSDGDVAVTVTTT